MATALEQGSRENCVGIKTVHGNRGDLAVIFSGTSALNNLDYLKGINAEFASRNLGWSEQVTRPFMEKAFDVSRLTGGQQLTPDLTSMIMEDQRKALQVPSTILLRSEAADPGDYFGISSGRMLFIPTSEGEKRVFFHILRSIDPNRRGRYRGRNLVELELLAHDQAEIYVHRSSNPIALYTNTKSDVLVQEGRHPKDSPYSDDPIAYEIAKAILRITAGEGYELEPSGVVRGLYKEPNKAYEPNPLYSGPFEYYQRMIRPISEGGWAMNLPAGDTQMAYYRIR